MEKKLVVMLISIKFTYFGIFSYYYNASRLLRDIFAVFGTACPTIPVRSVAKMP